MKISRRHRLLLLSLCAVLYPAHDAAFAQGRNGVAQNPQGPFASSVERRRAEQDLRSLPIKLRERREQNLADPKILEQMNEDFLRLQVMRAEMVKTFGAGGMIEPGSLENISAEVKRRASRLRSMLLLAEEQGPVKLETGKATTAEALNDRAFKLCIEISRFTENPMFKPGGSFSARHAGEADKTLGLIISLAGSIQSGSAALRKK